MEQKKHGTTALSRESNYSLHHIYKLIYENIIVADRDERNQITFTQDQYDQALATLKQRRIKRQRGV